VIVECNGRTLPQERYNAHWVTEKRLGIVLKDFKQINDGVDRLLDATTFAELRKNAGAHSNNALFEIPEFLDEIMERHNSEGAGPGSPVKSVTMLEKAAWAALTSRMEATYT
jgi:hypothetical protein